MHFSLGQVWLRNKTPFLPVHCLKLRNLRLVDWGLVRKGPGEPDSIFLSLCATLVLQLLSTFLQTSSPSTSIYLRQPKLSHPMSSSLFYFLWEPLKAIPRTCSLVLFCRPGPSSPFRAKNWGPPDLVLPSPAASHFRAGGIHGVFLFKVRRMPPSQSGLAASLSFKNHQPSDLPACIPTPHPGPE